MGNILKLLKLLTKSVKLLLVDKLSSAKLFFWLALVYRKRGQKVPFDLEDP